MSLEVLYYLAPLTCFIPLYSGINHFDYNFIPLFVLAHLFTLLAVLMCRQLEKHACFPAIIIFNQISYVTGSMMISNIDSMIWTYMAGWLGQLILAGVLVVIFVLGRLIMSSCRKDQKNISEV